MYSEQLASDKETVVPDNMFGTLTKEQAIFVAMFVTGDSISISELIEYTKLDKIEIEQAVENLKLVIKILGLEIIKSQEGLQLMTCNAAEKVISNIKKKELDGDLSSAALQVMTVIAYMPGCSRSDISYIRGTQSSSSVRNLISRGLVVRKDENCHITNEALAHLGVTSNDELPEYSRLHTEFTNKLSESLKYE